MLGPSPDWNVGLSAEDLCTKECGWVQKLVQDMIPWDAGTDSGVTYEVSVCEHVFPPSHCEVWDTLTDVTALSVCAGHLDQRRTLYRTEHHQERLHSEQQ